MSSLNLSSFKSLSTHATVGRKLRKGLSRSLLMASLAVLVSACDSPEQEVSEASSPQAKVAATDTAMASTDSAAASRTNILDTQADADFTEDMDEEGAGLLEFAEHRQSTPMIAGGAGDSLGATLIGDYSGMLPCSNGSDEEQVMLNLYADGTARKTSHHTEPKRTSNTQSQLGTYQQLDNIISIDFANTETEHYLINDNQLIFILGDLPAAGEEVAIQANPKYVLSRK